MTDYRDRTTGDIKTQGQVRRDNPNISVPKVWNSDICDLLNVDPILRSPKPTEGVGEYQVVRGNGVEQDANGSWVESWIIVDRFSDYTNEDGETVTKAEQEAEYQEILDSNAAKNNRSQRDRLIGETDWWAVSDRTMTAEQTAYRQALRDITTHANWPHLEADDWPTKPE